MEKTMVLQLFESVICLETGAVKLCGRQKCIDLLDAIQVYSAENELNISIENLGDLSSGKMYTKQAMAFYNEFLK